MSKEDSRAQYERFYLELLSEHKVYTDVLVLDELLYVSKKKYGIPYKITLEFIDTIILPYVVVLSLGEEEYTSAKEILIRYNIKPSDALHVASMKNNGIRHIVSEDKEFDKVEDVERIWLNKAL